MPANVGVECVSRRRTSGNYARIIRQTAVKRAATGLAGRAPSDRGSVSLARQMAIEIVRPRVRPFLKTESSASDAVIEHALRFHQITRREAVGEGLVEPAHMLERLFLGACAKSMEAHRRPELERPRRLVAS